MVAGKLKPSGYVPIHREWHHLIVSRESKSADFYYRCIWFRWGCLGSLPQHNHMGKSLSSVTLTELYPLKPKRIGDYRD